jgi:hypothetical protein
VTVPDPLPSAARVRKARRSSVVACGHYVLTGQVIVKRGGRWLCLECALKAIGKRSELDSVSTGTNT